MALIQQLCQCGAVRSLLYAGGGGAAAPSSALASLTALRKLCNHPALLHRGVSTEGADDDDALAGSDIERELAPLFPPGYQPGSPEHSGARMRSPL